MSDSIPLITALHNLDRALGAHEGASETQVKMCAPPYYALAKEMNSIRGPITSIIREHDVPISIRVGRILVLPV